MLTINSLYEFNPHKHPHIKEGTNPFHGVNISTEASPAQVAVETTNILAQQFTREVMNLKDKAITDALISLGWKPPSEVQKLEFIFDQEHSSVSVKKHGEVIMKCKLWEFTITSALNLLHTCGVEITKTYIDESRGTYASSV